eukprot:CAMPEP_0117870340 /NCGR_PEP_ID=MMETSP0950-20121206/9785_1 /TAXON_ID=44440 /ORGANISM="Chattonella subsalsa, Strain CCMP2191" /LENGTH=417 /DNA_ID=CAMNT_0005722615 /DNA_START=32 /DNA_END=1282 /DNA_ORIENTATION=-
MASSSGGNSNCNGACGNGTQKKLKGDALDQKLDKEIIKEFGGPVGCTLIMIAAPSIMYYYWICLQYYDGQSQYPTSLDDIKPFFARMWNHMKSDAFPTVYGGQIYLGFCLFQAILAVTMPGPVIQGLPVPSLNNKKLDYLCNGVSSWYLTLIVAFVLHYWNWFPLTDLIDNFGSIMTWSIITGNVVTVGTYVSAFITGTTHRMSGSIMYDLFMGASLNPRIGILDLKMWSEIRIPWKVLFFVSLSAAMKEMEVAGFISAPMLFMVLAHFLYVNACMKGEECIPTTWDIFYEKWGYMLIFWNFSGVPFSYCYSSLHILNMRKNGSPIEHSVTYTVAVYLLLIVGYYIWDTANSQKNKFRMRQRGTFIKRNTFPQLPWSILENPEYIKTEHGNLLLTGGWWGIARKIHYTADLMMALSW